ncbi:MAG TPA: HAMP domain-containing sensor histidine kinase [Pseudolysinimonas sp.]|nr:HAMP domain-containing sensor histidine kinase [Pseudolysinimonas sp.]
MRWQRLSVRARLTIGSSLLALVLLTAAVLLARAQVSSLLDTTDAALATSDLTPFLSDLKLNAGEHMDQPGPGVLVEIRDPSGTIEQNTLPEALQERVDHETGDGRIIRTTADGVPYTLASRTFTTDEGTWQLWAARSGAAHELAEQGLDRVLIIGGALLMLAFVVASWLLARAALRPVERLRRRAGELGDSVDADLLPVDASGDEIAQLAATLNAFLQRIRLSVDREKQMVSDAAHELRTPLAALRTQLELAHDDFDDPDALRLEIVAAEASVARLSSLAGNLLELARLEQASGFGSITDAAMADELAEAIDRARLLAVPKDARIVFSCELQPGTRYPLDRATLGRLLDNLLSNAVAAIAHGGSIEVELATVADVVVLSVRDDGHGVPDSFLPRAFDRFSRADDSRSSRSGGSGLGLALVKAISVNAGGNVTIRNTNPGLEVQVTLPRL